MSLIVTARLIARGYRSQALSLNFNALNLKICKAKNFCEIAAPLIQKRRFSDKKELASTISDNLEKIYDGKLAKKIKVVKIFSLTTSFLTLAVQPYLLPQLMESGQVVAPIAVGLISTIFTFGTPILLHIFTSKYVIDIHYNTKTKNYIATVFTILARKRKIEFTPNDVQQPELAQMLTNCIIKGKPLLIDITNFFDPHHYAIIMGYDKPIDFGLEEHLGGKKKVSPPKLYEDQLDSEQIGAKKSVRN